MLNQSILHLLKILALPTVLVCVCAANAWGADRDVREPSSTPVATGGAVVEKTALWIQDDGPPKADARSSHEEANDSAESASWCCPHGPLYFNAFSGYDYFGSSGGSSRVGGMMGAGLDYLPNTDWGATAKFTSDLEPGNSQCLGTVGFFKLPNRCSCCWRDRMSGSLLYDIFTDAKSETTFGQLRMRGGIASPLGVELGMIYTQPLSKNVGNPAGLIQEGIADVVLRQSIQAYVSAPVLLLHTLPVYTAIKTGWRNDPSSGILGANFEAPLTRRVAIFTGFDYEDRQGLWSQYTGANVNF